MPTIGDQWQKTFVEPRQGAQAENNGQQQEGVGAESLGIVYGRARGARHRLIVRHDIDKDPDVNEDASDQPGVPAINRAS